MAALSGRIWQTGVTMSKVEIQFMDRGFHGILFDAVPIPIFVVDGDERVLELGYQRRQRSATPEFRNKRLPN
jgi:hypothetical protein